jgi:hypothetical protein
MNLDEFMGAVPPQARSPLAQHLADMLALRERGYTLDQIRDFLARNNVLTTRSNLSAYLRRNALTTTKAGIELPSPNPNATPPTAGQATAAASESTSTASMPAQARPKFETWDPRGIDHALRNPPDIEALRKAGRERKRLALEDQRKAQKPG